MTRKRKYRALSITAALSAGGILISTASASYIYDANDFAVEVVSSTGLPGTTTTNSPSAVLGRPTLKFNNSANPNTPDFRRTKLIEGSFNTGLSGEKVVT